MTEAGPKPESKGRRRHPGRKSKLTQDLLDEVVDLICKGNTFKCAVTVAGISQNTAYRWLQEAEEENQAGPPKPGSKREFREQVEWAKQVAHEMVLGHVVNLSEVKFEAAKWLLKQRHPDVYSDRPDVVVEVTRKPVADDELAAWLEERGFLRGSGDDGEGSIG